MSEVICTKRYAYRCHWFSTQSGGRGGSRLLSCCWNCVHNKRATSRRKKEDNFVTHTDKVIAFYNYLIKEQNLSNKDAFAVVFYLQETMRVLSDSIEQCEYCKGLYDSDCEGTYIDKDWEWESLDGRTMVMPKEFWGGYHDECVPYVRSSEEAKRSYHA